MTKLLGLLSLTLLGSGLTLPALVSFHLIDVNEVYSNADGTLQYVELIASANGQTNLSATRVSAFNAEGTVETLVFDFTASIPGLRRNETILLATNAFQSVTGFSPDFVIPDGSISLDHGRAAFKRDSGSIVDALAYGVFTGSNAGFGAPAPMLPHDGLNSLGRISNTKNNALDFEIGLNSPRRKDGTTATIRGGGFMLALLSSTDEIIRLELATGDIVQRVPAGFDVKNSSGIEVGTALEVNDGDPFAVITQVDQDVVRLCDPDTLLEIGRIDKGEGDVGWSDAAFDGTNWIFSVPNGVVGDETFQGVDLIDMSASIATGRVVTFDSINLNSPDETFDVVGGVGIVRPGVAVVAGRTGSRLGGGDRALVQVLINNNRLMRGETLTTEVGSDEAQPGVSGSLVSISASHILVSVPGSASLQIIDPRTGQQVGTLSINGLDFTPDGAPDNAISGLSRETVDNGNPR